MAALMVVAVRVWGGMQSVDFHEKGVRHRQSVETRIRDTRKAHSDKERQDFELKKQLQQIELVSIWIAVRTRHLLQYMLSAFCFLFKGFSVAVPFRILHMKLLLSIVNGSGCTTGGVMTVQAAMAHAKADILGGLVDEKAYGFGACLLPMLGPLFFGGHPFLINVLRRREKNECRWFRRAARLVPIA